ncbi:DUF2817 domain-containing protein, partial [Staphylococcus aureus]
NKWHTDPHLAYIRKNVRIVCVPIVNPHGFANDSVYSYTFEPQHYSKTLLLTSCIHGNEYSAFYANSRFLDLVVNKWHTDPHLAYIRKNVRIVCVPIVNPHGFAND